MGVKKRWLFAILAAILALSLLPGCAAEKSTPTETEPPVTTPIPPSIPPPLPTPLEEVSLEEAEAIVGAPLMPKYLPPGYKFQRCVVFSWGPPAHLGVCFSDEVTEQGETTQGSSTWKILFNVTQETKIPPADHYERMAEQHGGKVVDINGTKGWLAGGPPGGSALVWFQSGLLFCMDAKELSEEELIKIAESIE